MLAFFGAPAQTSGQEPTKNPGMSTDKPAGSAPAAAKPAFDPALLEPATLKAKAPAEFEVKFVTTAGEFTMKVTRAWAPNGADRFYNLIQHHFYDGASFFRVLPGFMAQFGMSAYPQVSAAWQQANIKDDPVKSSNKPGTVTFAMAGPNTRTTQIFINLGDNARLDGMGFSAVDEVTSGMDVIKSCYSGYADAPTSHQGEITNEGKAYLDKNFPKLDYILKATVLP